MHLVTWRALRDELEKIAKGFIPVAKTVARKLRGKMPEALQHTPGKSTAEMAEWMGKYTPGYRQAAKKGVGPEMGQKGIERLGVTSSLQPGKTGRFMRPPSATQAAEATGSVERIGQLNTSLTRRVREANRMMAQSRTPAARGPLGIRSAPAGRPQMTTGVASPGALRRPQAATGVATPQAFRTAG